MSQVTRGIYSVLSSPLIYNTLQKLLGAGATRDKIVKRFIRPYAGMDLLDVGCGTAEILSHLPEGVRYQGFDASADYIAHARQQFGNRGDFRQGFVTKKTLESSRNYDLVSASGLLHHLEDEEIVVFAETAKQALRSTGRLVTIDCAHIPDQNPIARFLVSRDRGQNVRSPEGYAKFFPVDDGWDVKIHLCHDLLRLHYTHVVLEAQLLDRDDD